MRTLIKQMRCSVKREMIWQIIRDFVLGILMLASLMLISGVFDYFNAR